MSATSEVATMPDKEVLHPLVIWSRVQSTMRLISTMCSTQAYSMNHHYTCAPHSIVSACDDVARIARRENEELYELRHSHRQCPVWDAEELCLDTEAFLVAVHVMATHLSNPGNLGMEFSSTEILDAMDVLAFQALRRVSGDTPDAYDPPGGFPEQAEVAK